MTNSDHQFDAGNWPSPGQFRRSIRVEFSLLVSAMVLVLMVTAGYVITEKYVDTVTRGVVDKLLVQARAFSGTAGKHLISNVTPDALLLNNICKKLAADNRDVYWAGITDQSDQFVAHTDMRQVLAGAHLEKVPTDYYKGMLHPDEALALRNDTLLLSIPIEDNGVLLGRLGVASSTAQIAKAQRDSVVAVASVTIAMILIGLPVMMLGLRWKLKPVKTITDRLKSVSYDDFSLDVPITSRNEFGYLAATLRVAGRRLKEAQEERLEHDRVARELEIAREIQASILPREYPTGSTFACAGAYQSAREVGGDYYDFIRFSEKHLGILVADVSGKSLPGMLVMLMTRDIVRQVTRSLVSPADVLNRVNRELRTSIKPGMFVTMFFGVLDVESGRLAFASAGHNPLVHIKQGEVALIKTRGYPLGMMPPDKFEQRLEEGHLQLNPGDWAIQYTDGVNEALNPDRDEYGMNRFVTALDRSRNEAPEQLIAGILQDHGKFVAEAPQYDDITLVAVKWTGSTVDTRHNGQRDKVYAS